ncbi:Glycerol-3-phosphate acyltransferase [Nitrospira sp. KM1]|uniref:glycerol-3-phosphate 1-O-acyltransferase PlsY n=1 Tax=Nitrospira sp. KM1 TaxID=1936990 RepID=UPI0013A7460D|nr:glycerol-3-phosphate 1-O-acyltransferase PlsY [Nitrospira sp. KM1]BCA54043.1 Glycerol-3-phosphate acyltransferase [Nitrospira sp. KM1]
MDEVLLWSLLTALGFLLGAIPFGIVVSSAFGLPDPRTVGSMNVGFTNVLRVSGAKAGLLTLLGDMGKGWVMGWAAMQWLTDERFIMIVALAPILGHLFSPFLQFKGGKGVATALGSVLGLAPSIGLLLLLIWLGAVAIWRYSSGGALAAFGLFPVVAIVNEQRQEFLLFAIIVSVLIWVRHKDNIIRLWRGTESKIGEKRVQPS